MTKIQNGVTIGKKFYLSEQTCIMTTVKHTTIVDKIYWDNYEKRYCFGSHKQLKTLLRDHMVKLKIISLYIYKDLRLKT